MLGNYTVSVLAGFIKLLRHVWHTCVWTTDHICCSLELPCIRGCVTWDMASASRHKNNHHHSFSQTVCFTVRVSKRPLPALYCTSYSYVQVKPQRKEEHGNQVGKKSLYELNDNIKPTKDRCWAHLEKQWKQLQAIQLGEHGLPLKVMWWKKHLLELCACISHGLMLVEGIMCLCVPPFCNPGD